MICPMVEQAHLGTTRYTTLSVSVIQVPGKPMCSFLLRRVADQVGEAFAKKIKEFVFIQCVFTFTNEKHNRIQS
jgi:hypothetical protein